MIYYVYNVHNSVIFLNARLNAYGCGWKNWAWTFLFWFGFYDLLSMYLWRKIIEHIAFLVMFASRFLLLPFIDYYSFVCDDRLQYTVYLFWIITHHRIFALNRRRSFYTFAWVGVFIYFDIFHNFVSFSNFILLFSYFLHCFGFSNTIYLQIGDKK